MKVETHQAVTDFTWNHLQSYWSPSLCSISPFDHPLVYSVLQPDPGSPFCLGSHAWRPQKKAGAREGHKMLHFAGRPRVVYTSADSSSLSTRGVQTVSLRPTRSQNLVPKGQTWSKNLGDIHGMLLGYTPNICWWDVNGNGIYDIRI